MSNNVCYYYQTFNGLNDILANPMVVNVILLSSIHFGTNNDGSPYIHLNDHSPYDKIFDQVWDETKHCHDLGITITVMLGGAGGAYSYMTQDFDTYYNLLKDMINKYSWIQGIDLDIEEFVDINLVRKLIDRLDKDFGSAFIITMAPLPSSLSSNTIGMGGFKYSDLHKTSEGKRIDWFNVQAYGSFTSETFDSIIKNGYHPEQIVLGMLSGEYNKTNFNQALTEVRKIKSSYGDFGGVYNWEYFNSPPNGESDPNQWGVLMSKAMEDKTCCCFF